MKRGTPNMTPYLQNRPGILQKEAAVAARELPLMLLLHALKSRCTFMKVVWGVHESDYCRVGRVWWGGKREDSIFIQLPSK